MIALAKINGAILMFIAIIMFPVVLIAPYFMDTPITPSIGNLIGRSISVFMCFSIGLILFRLRAIIRNEVSMNDPSSTFN